MAPAQDSPSKKRTSWTPELNQQLFMALLKTLDPSAINYGKIAEELGGGFSNQAIYKRIYDIKNRGVSFEISAAAPKKPNSTTTTPKKRKVAADAEEDL